MKYSTSFHFFIIASCISFLPSLGSDKNAELLKIMQGIPESYDKAGPLFPQVQTKTMKFFQDNPQKAFVNILCYGIAFNIAVSRGNIEVVDCMLKGKNIPLTPKEKYVVIYTALSCNNSFDMASILITRYNFSLFLPDKPQTITNSIFKSIILSIAKDSEHPEKKEPHIQFLNHVLALANKLPEQDFYQFTRCPLCPFKQIEDLKNYLPGNDKSIYSLMRSCLIAYKVRCSSTQECQKMHPEITHFCYMKELLYKPI